MNHIMRRSIRRHSAKMFCRVGATSRWLSIVAAVAMGMALPRDATAQSSNAAPSSSVTPPVQPEYPTSPEGPKDAATEEALRRAVWHSTEMLAAREYVLAYSERSKRMTRTDGERYLRRVSQLSSEQMQEWLGRVRQQRAALERRRTAEEEARALSVGLAEERLRKMDEAGYNAGQTKAWMTEIWRQQAELAPAAATSARLPLAERAAALAAQRLAFDPFAPTLDPASPGAYERYAAAASLPGDLPRGDPANSYVGDDRGGNAPPPGSDGTVGGSGVGAGGAAAPAAPAAPAGDGGGAGGAGP